MNSITKIAKNMYIKHNVIFRVIDRGTNKVVREYSGHNQATNTMLTGIGHYIAGDGTLNQAKALLDSYVPKYISLGTMGLVSQDEDANGLPLGISGYNVAPDAGVVDKYTAYMKEEPGYSADGYNNTQNNDRPAFGLGPKYSVGDDPDNPDPALGCELISDTFPRVRIAHSEVIPETNTETPETVDVVLSAMISTGALAEFRGNADHIFITEAGLWSTNKFNSNGAGLLAGYRIKPPNDEDWDMSVETNRQKLQAEVIRVGINQVVQVIWKIQIGAKETLTREVPIIPETQMFGTATFTQIQTGASTDDIKCTYFQEDTQVLSEQRDVLYNWLVANASPYFDYIQKQGDSDTIWCGVSGNLTALILGFSSSYKRVTCMTSTSSSIATYASSQSRLFRYGWVTKYGLVIDWAEEASNRYGYLFITKTNQGTTALVIATQTASSTYQYAVIDVTNSGSIPRYYSGSSFLGTNDSARFWAIPTNFTSLTPIAAADANTYLPAMYMFRFSQQAVDGVEHHYEVDFNGSKYFTNTMLVLKAK